MNKVSKWGFWFICVTQFTNSSDFQLNLTSMLASKFAFPSLKRPIQLHRKYWLHGVVKDSFWNAAFENSITFLFQSRFGPRGKREKLSYMKINLFLSLKIKRRKPPLPFSEWEENRSFFTEKGELKCSVYWRIRNLLKRRRRNPLFFWMRRKELIFEEGELNCSIYWSMGDSLNKRSKQFLRLLLDKIFQVLWATYQRNTPSSH